MPRIDVNGTELFYRVDGQGSETVLMAHGLLMDHSMYDAQVAALASRYRVVRYDHRGQGDSAPTRSGLDLDTLCADAAALIERIGNGPVHFVGMSMGGFVGLRLAARHPEKVRSLILIDTSAGTDTLRARLRFRAMWVGAHLLGLRPFVPAMLKLMFGASTLADPAQAGMIAHWRARLNARPRAVLRAVGPVIARADVGALLSNIRCPTQVIVGDEDRITGLACAERIAAGIEGARLARVPKVGHSSNMEAPDAVNAILDAHFARIRA